MPGVWSDRVTESWRRQFVHDMLFAIEGSGWHEPEMKDAIGYRWSGPGHLSVLRVSAPPGAGRGEARLLLLQGETPPDLAVFLNGRRLAASLARRGTLAVLDFAWDAEAMAGESRAEFWFHAERLAQLPVPGGRMRAAGFRLSTLTLTCTAAGPPLAEEALALVLGRRFLIERLSVAPGRARFALRTEGEARLLDLRLEAARLGPTAQPQLTLALRAALGGIGVTLAAPGGTQVHLLLDPADRMVLPAALAPRDAMLVARLLTTLPDAFGRWLDGLGADEAPEAAQLASWRRGLARLARAAEAAMAAALADGPDPFALPAEAPFAWPKPR
jgi:hypothetical protein